MPITIAMSFVPGEEWRERAAVFNERRAKGAQALHSRQQLAKPSDAYRHIREMS
jgi:hypothetical protein